MTDRESWERWRAILDRIIAHKDYRYDSPRKYTLLKMADMAMSMMGLYNNRHWKNHAS